MIKSFFFLWGLYFLRHIPLTIFWGLYSFLPKKKLLKSRVIYLMVLLALGYGTSFFLLLSGLIFVLNALIANDFQSTVLPILLTEEFIAYGKLSRTEEKNFALLLSPLVCSKRLVLPFKLILRLLEFLALIFIGIGLVDIFNDVNSHANPDLFDFLFPLSGALTFYGGIILLSLTSFFLYFLLPPKNIRQWKKRLEKSSNFPAGLRNQVLSPSLLHPYFFLTPKSRFLTAKNNIPPETLSLLLQKALLRNIDHLPEEWLEELIVKKEELR